MKKHSTPDDAWLVLDGYVIDINSFVAMHPGGRQVLFSNAGRDATAAFERIKHSKKARVLSTNFRIGRVPAASSGSITEPAEATPGSRNQHDR